MASYNLIDTKYRQMAFRSLSNDTPISPYEKSFTPGQIKVRGDQQRETTHDFFYLAVEWWGGGKCDKILFSSQSSRILSIQKYVQ